MSLSHSQRQQRYYSKNKAYYKKWRLLNKENYKKWRKHWQKQNIRKILASANKRRGDKRDYINKLRDNPCSDCGFRYPLFIMHFDHRNPKQKIDSISRMTTRSLTKIKKEIAKCDLVCANCHGIRTRDAMFSGKIKMFGKYREN